MSIEISPKSFFEQPSVADMRLIACPGADVPYVPLRFC